MGLMQTYSSGGRDLHLYEYEGAAGVGASSEACGAEVHAPGAGEFEFGALGAEWQQDVISLTAEIKCRNLAYLFAELFIRGEHEDVYYGPVSREYVRAQKNEGSSGITRPVWGDKVEVSVRLRPLLRLLTNGADYSFCFALPEGYSSPGYRQSGLYSVAGEAEPLRALLGFSGEGALRRVIAYRQHERRTGARARAGARVITPAQGDSFVPFAQVLTVSEAGDGMTFGIALGDTLVLGSWPMRAVTERALPGEYLVGVIAQDLDGGIERKYVSVHLGG